MVMVGSSARQEMVPRATGGIQGRTPSEVGIIDDPEGLGFFGGAFFGWENNSGVRPQAEII